MSKTTRILMFALSLCGMVAYSSASHAFFLMKLIKSSSVQLPMPDFLNEGMSLGNSVGALAETAMKTKNTTENTLNNMRTALNSVFNFNFSAKVDGKVNPGQLEIISCKVGEINLDLQKKGENGEIDYDAVSNSVQEAVDTLFFQYPANEIAVRNAYREKRDKFYEDTVVEIRGASLQLQKDMKERVVPTLTEAAEAVKNGSGDNPAPDQNTEAIHAEGKFLEAVDNLLEVLQKAEALKVQLRAVKAIRNISPRPYKEPENDGKTAALLRPQNSGVITLARVAQSETWGFAQLGLTSSARATSAGLAEIEDNTLLKGNSAQRKVTKTLTVSEAPEPEIFHAYDLEQEKMAELEKIEPLTTDVNAAVSAHNMIRELDSYKQGAENYHKAEAEHRESLEALKKSNQCAVSYIGHHFAAPESVWAGRVMGNAVNAHELRSGISGWSVEAFEAAKAAQTSNVSTDNIISPNIDVDNEEYYDITNSEKNIASFTAAQPISSTASQEEQSAKEARESMLLPWQIGSEASKMLAAEPEKWGQITTPFPVWNDVKSFYNQYLSGKYANIRKYLKMFTASDVKALALAALSGQEQDATATRGQKEAAKLDADLTEQQDELQKQQSAEEKQYLSAGEKELAALESKRQRILDSLNAATERYKEISDEIADLRRQSKDDAVKSLQDDAKYFESFKDRSVSLPEASRGYGHFAAAFTVGGARIVKTDDLKAEIGSQSAANLQNGNLEQLEQQLKAQEQTVSNLQKQLEAADAEISRKKLALQEQSDGIRGKFLAKLLEAKKNADKKREAAAASFAAAADANINKMAAAIVAAAEEAFAKQNPGKPYTGITSKVLISGFNKVVDKALDDLYAKVEARIKAAEAELAALGDNLYNPVSHSRIVDIHQRMINDIKALSITVVYKPMNIAATLYLYQKLIPADVSAEAEDYFVGSPAKERDLKAPMAVFAFNLPPLRETVHFDDVDFQNVKPFDASRKKSEIITRQDFLNYGGYIPEVWKYMLKDHAFVETDLNLKTALNTGCTGQAFFRGGILPCKVKDTVMVIDVDGEGNFFRSQLPAASMPVCPTFEMRSGQVYDFNQDVNIKLSAGLPFLSGNKKSEAADCAYSELGALLDADENNNIFFKQPVYDAFYLMIKSQKEIEDGKETPSGDQQKLAAYSIAPLAVDQIGDFLNYVENEQNKRQHKEELYASYQEMMTTLKTMLAEYGYEASDDLDLSRAADYKLVHSRLKAVKNGRISSALGKIGAIKTEDNSVVEDRVNKLKEVINALQKDKNEDVTISVAGVENNNIDEEIKTSKVSKQAIGKYEDNLNQIAEKLNLPAIPYCARY